MTAVVPINIILAISNHDKNQDPICSPLLTIVLEALLVRTHGPLKITSLTRRCSKSKSNPLGGICRLATTALSFCIAQNASHPGVTSMSRAFMGWSLFFFRPATMNKTKEIVTRRFEVVILRITKESFEKPFCKQYNNWFTGLDHCMTHVNLSHGSAFTFSPSRSLPHPCSGRSRSLGLSGTTQHTPGARKNAPLTSRFLHTARLREEFQENLQQCTKWACCAKPSEKSWTKTNYEKLNLQNTK